ncbi:unnamed protein product [Prunus armeniaca]
MNTKPELAEDGGCSRSFASLSTQASICFLQFQLLRPPGSAPKKDPTRLRRPPSRLAPAQPSSRPPRPIFWSLKHKMPRIDSKRLPLRLKRSCPDVLNPSLMADIVAEHWIQIQRLEQVHITQILTFDHALLFAERKKRKKKKDLSPPPVA